MAKAAAKQGGLDRSWRSYATSGVESAYDDDDDDDDDDYKTSNGTHNVRKMNWNYETKSINCIVWLYRWQPERSHSGLLSLTSSFDIS